MEDFRQAYFQAREEVAEYLKEKHQLIESYKDDNRLTLYSSTNSIHLTFLIPDGIDVFITDLDKLPSWDTSFMSLVSKKYTNDSELDTILKNIFKLKQKKKSSTYSNLLNRIQFLEKEYSQSFN